MGMRCTFQSALGDKLLVRNMSGVEAVSRPFEFSGYLASKDADIDLKTLIGKEAAFRFEPEHGAARWFHGLVIRFTYAGRNDQHSDYGVTLVPTLWRLSQKANHRIFQQKSAIDIVKILLGEGGVTRVQYELQGSPPVREYCVQYRETDLEFVSRLLEEEGIHYFFRHDAGGHTMIVSDSSKTAPVCPEMPKCKHLSGVESDRSEGVVEDWQATQALLTGRSASTDYDFTAPQKSLLVGKTGNGLPDAATLERFEYPGLYADSGGGERLAAIRVEGFEADTVSVHGRGTCHGMMGGHSFELSEHPRGDFRGKRFVLLQVAHSIDQGTLLQAGSAAGAEAGYSNSFVAMPMTTPYRPQRSTARPVIAGTQTARVVGPAGEEIYTDEFGRVKVQFHWDREGRRDEKSSCWIRVAQGWAGQGYGMFSLPRIDQEVVIAFLEGNPDRPLIVGSVYNREQSTPYELPGRKTLSTWKSNSTKGGGGANEIRIEDQKGAEQLLFHAEKDQDVRVKNDRREWIGKDTHLHVVKDRLEQIDNDHHEKIGRHRHVEVAKDDHLKITGKQAVEIAESQSLTIKGDVIHVFKKSHSQETTKDYYLKAKQIVIESTTGITLVCGGSSVVIDSAGVTVKGSLVSIDGAMVKIASGPGSPPQSGSAGSAVPPTAPKQPAEARKPE